MVDRQVTHGQVVQPSDALFTVADLSTVWVIADVPEQESSSLAVAAEASQIEVPALPAEPLKASLDYVDAIVDPETRTVLIRSELRRSRGPAEAGHARHARDGRATGRGPR